MRLDRQALGGLLEEYAPEAKLLRVRRLRGGLGAHSHVLDIEAPDSTRSKVVLRRYLLGSKESASPARAEREFRTLQMVRAAGVPAAEALYLDVAGRHFGTPTMLLSYVPGRSLYLAHDVGRWTEDLARAMLCIHAVTPDRYDLSWLPPLGRQEVGEELEARRPQVEAHEEPLAREVLAALEAKLDRIEWLEPCLVHEDFWSGNTVWYRGRLTAVIDWSDACLGDPRLDPAQCRIDAVIANGFEVGDALLEAYQRLAPHPLEEHWYFDLLIGLRALLYYERWLAGYHDAGLTFVTRNLARERVHGFLRRALAIASQDDHATK